MQNLGFFLLLPFLLGLYACEETPEELFENGGPENHLATQAQGDNANQAPAESIDAVSFNVQFLGHFRDKRNDDLAVILEAFDLIFVQELVAPPFDCTFPNGDPCNPDDEAAGFFNAMMAKDFSFVLSPEDTGRGENNHLNSTATEWWVAFFMPERIAPASDIPNGFLADDRTAHPDFERVPYAFGFRFDDKTDMVFISTHLKPGYGSDDQHRRAHEIQSIFSWINQNDEIEKDFIVLGDMNIDDCEELAAVVPAGFQSLNDSCLPTNTNPNDPRPYDHVIYSTADSGQEIADFFEVLNLMNLVQPLWQEAEPFPGDPYVHNDFRTRFSDHHPIHFKIKVGEDDD